jgi:hypothetical protein
LQSEEPPKSELKFQGIPIPSYDKAQWTHNFLNWIEEQAMKDEDLKQTLLLMLEEVKMLRMLILKTECKVNMITSMQQSLFMGADVSSRAFCFGSIFFQVILVASRKLIRNDEKHKRVECQD